MTKSSHPQDWVVTMLRGIQSLWQQKSLLDLARMYSKGPRCLGCDLVVQNSKYPSPSHKVANLGGCCCQTCRVSPIEALDFPSGILVAACCAAPLLLSSSSRRHKCYLYGSIPKEGGPTRRPRAKTNKIPTQTLKWPPNCIGRSPVFRSDEFVRSFVGRIGWPFPWNPIILSDLLIPT